MKSQNCSVGTCWILASTIKRFLMEIFWVVDNLASFSSKEMGDQAPGLTPSYIPIVIAPCYDVCLFAPSSHWNYVWYHYTEAVVSVDPPSHSKHPWRSSREHGATGWANHAISDIVANRSCMLHGTGTILNFGNFYLEINNWELCDFVDVIR